jgi:hypothetical protein
VIARVAAAVLCLVALSACQKDAKQLATPSIGSTAEIVGSPKDSRLDPCALTTPREVTAAIGAPVGDPRRVTALFYLLDKNGVDGWACDYRLIGQIPGRVRIRVTGTRAPEIFAALANASTRVAIANVSAVWQQSGRALWLQARDRVVSIEIPLLRDGSDGRALALTLAKRIVPRLVR